MDLAEALVVGNVVSVVGAGGKKSAMYRLADAFDTPVLTATVQIPIFDPHVRHVVVTEEPIDALEAADDGDFPLGLVPARAGADRYRGYEPDVVDRLAEHARPDVVIVKADGARMRKFKAPGDREPRIPSASTTVLVLLSAHVIGRPLDAASIHRPDRVAALAGLEPAEVLTPEAIAAVVTDPAGGRKGVPPAASVIAVINMVDTAADERRARRAAEAILAAGGVARVVLTRLTAPSPVVAVLA